MTKETRGDRRSVKSELKRQSVMEFISSFKAIEPHYCRSKTTRRLYWRSELSMRSMWKMYNKDAAEILDVRQHFFRNIFDKNFNLGFGSFIVEVCSKCLELRDKIKSANEKRRKTYNRQKNSWTKSESFLLFTKKNGFLLCSLITRRICCYQKFLIKKHILAVNEGSTTLLPL